MGEYLGEKAPKIFNVNWFRTDEDGKFIWPGFGENFRVLKWILARCENEVEAKKCEIGLIPEEIDFEGIEISEEAKKDLFAVDHELWQQEIKEIEAFYQKLDYVPYVLKRELEYLKQCVENVNTP